MQNVWCPQYMHSNLNVGDGFRKKLWMARVSEEPCTLSIEFNQFLKLLHKRGLCQMAQRWQIIYEYVRLLSANQLRWIEIKGYSLTILSETQVEIFGPKKILERILLGLSHPNVTNFTVNSFERSTLNWKGEKTSHLLDYWWTRVWNMGCYLSISKNHKSDVFQFDCNPNFTADCAEYS